MWDSPYFLEQHARDRVRSLSKHLAECRLAEEYGRGRPRRWRRVLARRLAALSARLDRGEALAALHAGPFL